MYKGPKDKTKGGNNWGWEMGVGGAGEIGGGKMETSVLEQQLKMQKYIIKYKK